MVNATDSESSCEAHPDPFASDPSSPAYQVHLGLWIVTIVFCIWAVSMSLYLMWQHLRNYNQPFFQRYIVRIIFMVPLYSVISSLEFRYPWYSSLLAVARDSYEAFVLYSFYTLMLHYLGPTFEVQHSKLANKPNFAYPFPFNCMKYSPRGHAFLINCQLCTLQYAVIKVILTLIAIGLESKGLMCVHGPAGPAFWMEFINFTSCSVALYSLVVFYTVTHDELAPLRPLWKFIAIKFVIFFSYWQSILLSILSSYGLLNLPASFGVSSTTVSDAAQSWLICLEMVVAAYLHAKAFGYTEFVEDTRTQWWRAAGEAVNVLDVVADVTEAPGQVHQLRQYRHAKREYKKIETYTDAFADVDVLACRSPNSAGSAELHDFEFDGGLDEPDVALVPTKTIPLGSSEVLLPKGGRK